MKVSLASSADLYREHRRTSSPRKRRKVAAELQRRHDEQYSRPGEGNKWWRWEALLVEREGKVQVGAGRWVETFRFDFTVMLP